MYSKNLDVNNGRGLLLYINSSLKSQEIEICSAFEENMFVEVELNGHNKLLIGLIYRSENGTAENNVMLNSLLTEARKLRHSHLLLMGDFNFPNICWANNSTSSSITSPDSLFLECVEENFLLQNVDKPTRWRGSNNPHILDLIITNEEDMISILIYMIVLWARVTTVHFFLMIYVDPNL